MSSEQFNADRFLKTVSTSPGVYIMRDGDGTIIYVGKARNLKNRLSTYFKVRQLPLKTEALVFNIASIETTITETENEALLLESNLIKEHRPRYNVRLIDDKSYPYIYQSDHKYPQFSFYRGSRKKRGTFYGPFPSSGAVRETLNLMKKVFKVRQCDDTFFSHRTRPCLQYQIDRCSGPCVNKISHEEYLHDVKATSLFLNGESQELIRQLADQMELHSHQLEFEEAAEIRDQIQYIHQIQGSNNMEEGRGSFDLLALYQEAEVAVVEVMTIRDGRVLGTRAYYPQVPKDTTETEILSSFILQYYGSHRRPPVQIVLNIGIDVDEQRWIEEGLSELSARKTTLQYRVRGQKSRWLNMTINNAKQSVKVKLAGKATIENRLQALQQVLHLQEEITRIECFDISHSFGERTVASNVVYTEQGFTKKYYRRYNITGITAGDDYAAMNQVLTRRFRRKEAETYPDVLLIDGGKGQLHIAVNLLKELEIEDITVVGIAEGEGKKRGLDKLWLAGDILIDIQPTSSAFHLVTQIRNEAHRFAIEGHRAQRDKARRRSILEEIPGIGEKRRIALLSHFGGLDALRNASVEDISRVEGISTTLAESVYQYFRENQ